MNRIVLAVATAALASAAGLAGPAVGQSAPPAL